MVCDAGFKASGQKIEVYSKMLCSTIDMTGFKTKVLVVEPRQRIIVLPH